MNKIEKKVKGYTLVELVVTISVIGILATIAYVGYGSWRNNITISQLKSDLIQASAAMENYRNFHDVYPTSVTQIFTPSDGVSLGGGDFDGTNKYQLTALKNKIFYHIDNVKKTPEEGLGDGIVTPGLVVYLDANSNRSNTGDPGKWVNLIDKIESTFYPSCINSGEDSGIKYFEFCGSEPGVVDESSKDQSDPAYFNTSVKVTNPDSLNKQQASEQSWTVVAVVNIRKDIPGAVNEYYQQLVGINEGIEVVWGRGGVGGGTNDYIDQASVTRSWQYRKPLMYLHDSSSPGEYSVYGGLAAKFGINSAQDLNYTLMDEKWHLVSYVFKHSSSEKISDVYDSNMNITSNKPSINDIITNSKLPIDGLPDYLRVGHKLKGKLSKILIYDRAFFSPEEIKQNYCAEYPTYYSDSNNIPANLPGGYQAC